MDIIYPEMNQTTNAEIEVHVTYNSKMYLVTDLKLKGRGIKKIGDGTDHKRGKKSYLATEKAFEIIKNKYNCCIIASL